MHKNKIKQNLQKGFTLIELMITVTIIGVIVTFAVPMFQDYIVRTRLSEGLVLATPAQALVIDNVINGKGEYGAGGLAQGWDGIEPTANIQSIIIDSVTGMIKITGTAKANNQVLYLVPAEVSKENTVNGFGREVPIRGIKWSCNFNDGSPASSPDDPKSQFPPECRNWQKHVFN